MNLLGSVAVKNMSAQTSSMNVRKKIGLPCPHHKPYQYQKELTLCQGALHYVNNHCIVLFYFFCF